MPYEDPDPQDPMMLHGMSFETDDEAIRDMATSFIEEYLRLGFSADRILNLFATSGYAGPHLAYRVLGETIIASLLDEHLRRRGPRQHRLRVDRNARDDINLPVLEGQ